MEDDLKNKINLIGCDTIVNSPSYLSDSNNPTRELIIRDLHWAKLLYDFKVAVGFQEWPFF